jgi:hypothetical protein
MGLKFSKKLSGHIFRCLFGDIHGIVAECIVPFKQPLVVSVYVEVTGYLVGSMRFDELCLNLDDSFGRNRDVEGLLMGSLNPVIISHGNHV